MSSGIRDENNLPDIIEEIRRIENGSVHAGWIEGQTSDEILTRAGVHEYGARIPVSDQMRKFFAAMGFPLSERTTHVEIPERAPIRTTTEDPFTQKLIESEWERVIWEVLSGDLTANQALSQIGETGVAEIKRHITDGLEPENHPLTVLLKGSAKPLVDSGQMLNALTYEVDE